MFDNIIEKYSEVVNAFRRHIDPNGVLAGGALRDTFYGREVKDLDFVTTRDLAPQAQSLRTVFPDYTFRWIPVEQVGHYAEGADNPSGLIDVIESTDKTINIIEVQDIARYTRNFPDSISEMVFDGTTVYTSARWSIGLVNDEVYYNADRMTQARLDKLQLKYPDFAFLPEINEGDE